MSSINTNETLKKQLKKAIIKCWKQSISNSHTIYSSTIVAHIFCFLLTLYDTISSWMLSFATPECFEL